MLVYLTVFLKKQSFKLQFSYVVLSTIALGFLIASVVVPYLGAALNWVRTFQIMLIVLAPFLAIGFIRIGETAGVTMRKVTSKLGFGILSASEPLAFDKGARYILGVFYVAFDRLFICPYRGLSEYRAEQSG